MKRRRSHVFRRGRSFFLASALASLAIFIAPSVYADGAQLKKAGEWVTQADVEAVLGTKVYPPQYPNGLADANTTACTYSNVDPFTGRANGQPIYFGVSVTYNEKPDPAAVRQFFKDIDKNTQLDRDDVHPVADLGDAAFWTGIPTSVSLTVFRGGNQTFSFNGSSLDKVKALAMRAFKGNGKTGFHYDGVNDTGPTIARPGLPVINAGSSELDRVKVALTKKADAGDVKVQLLLANLYRDGNVNAKGVNQPDYPAAMYWYRQAADHDSKEAAYALGMMYDQGIGTAIDEEAAKDLLGKAARAGYVPAMIPLCAIYAQSKDVVSQHRGIDWASKAAAAGDPEGHLIMGRLWESGYMSMGDMNDAGPGALREYTKAAAAGNAVAMMNIGGLYFNGGKGIAQNATEAKAWFAKAEAAAGKQLDDIRAKAAKYRALAEAGHLPSPPVPTERLRTGALSSGNFSPQHDVLKAVIGAELTLATLALAELAAHPEMLKDLPNTSVGTGADDDYPGGPMQKLTDDINETNIERAIYAGKPMPVRMP